jgi:hypothetical protein
VSAEPEPQPAQEGEAEQTATAGQEAEADQHRGAASLAAGSYVDTDGTVRNFDAEYERQAQTPEPHHLRTWTQTGIGLTALSLGYWLGMDRQVADWDNPRPQQRFDGTAWRTDNNALAVNYILHPLGGGAAYSFARANHHGVAMSAAYGFIGSFLWEFVLEFKEKVSVNDIFVTPGTGIPIGEFMYKLGAYLDTAQQPGTGTQVAQWTLGTGVRVDRALDGRGPTPARTRDSLGLTSEIWHDFEFDFDFHMVQGVAPAEYARYTAGFSGLLVSLPGYLRPGRFGRAFWRADLASMEIWGEGSGHGAGVGMASDALLAGYHAQSIDGFFSPRAGQAITTGVSMAWSYLESTANQVSEKFSGFHLPGPGLDWHVLGKDVRLSLSARAHPDYVGAGVLGAYPDWLAAHRGERGKHVLRIQGYYYGWGGSGQLSGRLELGPLQLRGGLFYGRYRSEEGNNRWQERITIDTPCGTQLLQYHGDLQLRPPGSPVAFGVGASVRDWKIWVGEIRRSAHVLSRGFQVSARF